jgi:hypothetical protein
MATTPADAPMAVYQREIDLLNATVFGVQGQGGLLREIEGLRQQLRRNTQAIVVGTLTMAGALVALAAAVANLH